MKNNKGFTLVELITSFALASVIMIFIFNIVVILKNNYISKSVRTDLLIKQSLLSQKMNEDFTNNNVKDVVTCDSDKKCYEFTFADDTVKQLKISADDKTITYGDYTYELTNSSYTSKINVSAKSITLDDVTLNDSILVIDIPILNKKYTDTNFGVKVVYQYNSHIVDLNTEEVTPFAFNVGDYVIMTPTSTSFTTDPSKTGSATTQTINPSELNLWRVIDIKSNGRVDMVSEYVSSATVNFNGVAGYKNYVSYLNTIANQYKNNNYTSSARIVGYNNQIGVLANTQLYDGSLIPTDSANYSSKYDVKSCYAGSSGCTYTAADEALGYGDDYHLADLNLVNTATGSVVGHPVNAPATEKSYWVASRAYWRGNDINGNGYFRFYARLVRTATDGYATGSTIGNEGWAYLYSYSCSSSTYDACSGGSWHDNTREDSDVYANAAIRPIVTLKSGITPTGGDGTAASPYTLD